MILANDTQEPGDDIVDYTRPLTDYATAQGIADFLRKREKIYEIDINTLSKNGEVIQDDMEVYLQNPAYNSSTFKEALKSPLHLFYERESGWKKKLEKLKKEEEFKRLGTFLHSCVLEPSKFNMVLVEPAANRASLSGYNTLIKFLEKKVNSLNPTLIKKAKAFTRRKKLSLEKMDGKRTYYEKLKKLSCLKSITAEQKIIIDAVKFNYNRYGGGILPQLMKGAKTEVSMYYTDPETGMHIRIRPDAIQFAKNIEADRKVKSFGRSFF